MSDDTAQAAGKGMSEERIQHIASCLEASDIAGLAEGFARELLAEVERLRGQQFEGGEQHDRWIVEFRQLHDDVGNITWTDIDRDTADKMISHYQRTSQLLDAYLAVRDVLARSEAEAAKLRARLAEIGETEVEWAADGPAGWMQWPFASEQFARGIVEQAAQSGVTVKLMRRVVGEWREVSNA